jgi:hypothetical protein
MASAARSHVGSAGSVQKPASLKTSLGGVIALCWSLGCGTTPLDAVVSETGAEGAAAADPSCSEPGAGRFNLRAVQTSLCLSMGAPTLVFGDPAFMTEMLKDCASLLAQWDLTPSFGDTYTLRNVESQLSLDVRTGADTPGTPLILFAPNTLDNQRFELRPRAKNDYELSPRNAPTLCAQPAAGGVQIWPCQASNLGQSFQLDLLSCQ